MGPPSNLTYEGTYWRWIERAWLGGLRLMVMGVNENRVLCELQANRTTRCNEMDTVRRGFKDIRELQHYVDAQAGGPGKGFFQIVTNPIEARRVINAGQDGGGARDRDLRAVRLPQPGDARPATRRRSTASSTRCTSLGVRSSLLLNKFDNPLAGVRFDGGPFGVLINAGNQQSAGSFWSAETCTGPLHGQRDLRRRRPRPARRSTRLLGAARRAAAAPRPPIRPRRTATRAG